MKKMNGLNVFLTFNLTRCFCLHNFHHEHQLHFCFFFSHCRHVFGIKHPKRERETCFSRQVVLKELLRSGLPSKVNVQVCPPSRHVGFVYLFPELLRRAGLCGYFFKEVWGKCAWFLDLYCTDLGSTRCLSTESLFLNGRKRSLASRE